MENDKLPNTNVDANQEYTFPVITNYYDPPKQKKISLADILPETDIREKHKVFIPYIELLRIKENQIAMFERIIKVEKQNEQLNEINKKLDMLMKKIDN